MALKNTHNGQYIKINLDGTYRIYKSSKERAREKSAPPAKKIIFKYKSLILELLQDKERCYYDPDFVVIIQKWRTEAIKYYNAYSRGEKARGFPLMKQYIKNIEQSLPDIICEGQLGVEGNTLEEVYNSVKRYGYFEEVEDC